MFIDIAAIITNIKNVLKFIIKEMRTLYTRNAFFAFMARFK